MAYLHGNICSRNYWNRTTTVNVIIKAWMVGLQGGPKKYGTILLYALTLSNINKLTKLHHCQNQKKIFNNTIT